MRRFLIAVASCVVAWLAVSLVYGLFAAIVFDPAYALAKALSGGDKPYYSTYSGINGLIILVPTLVVAARIYRTWTRRWAGGQPEQSASTSSAWPTAATDDAGSAFSSVTAPEFGAAPHATQPTGEGPEQPRVDELR